MEIIKDNADEDTELKNIIFDLIYNKFKGKFMLLITHRLVTMKHCDEIIVINQVNCGVGNLLRRLVLILRFTYIFHDWLQTGVKKLKTNIYLKEEIVMEMTYDGMLVMPSSYAVMNEEEMTYVEGGGKLTVKASASTVRTICRAGVALVGAAIGQAFGGPLLARLISGGLATLIYDFILDRCGYKYQAINKTWDKSWLPTTTFNLNNYV